MLRPINPSILFLLIITVLVINACNPHKKKPDHPAYIDQLLVKAWQLYDDHHQKEAFRLLDNGYAVLKNPGLGDHWKVYYFKHLASLYTVRKSGSREQLKQTSLYADSLLNLFNSNNNRETYKNEWSISNFAKGDALFEFGKFKEAYQYFYQGKILADKTQDKCDQSFFDNRFALLNFKQEKFKEAASLFMQNYRDELNCSRDFAAFAATQGALTNAGQSYFHAGMADSALHCYLLAQDYIQKNKQRFPVKTRFANDALGVVYGNLADVYKVLGKVDLAEKYYQLNISLNSVSGNEQMNSQVMQARLARLYFETGRLKESGELMDGIRASLDTLQNKPVELEWNKLKWNYYDTLKQRDKARPFLLAYLKLKDSADAKTMKVIIADAGSSFVSLQQENDINLLKKERQLRNLYLIIAVVFSVMILIIIILMLRSWKNSKVQNENLLLLNQKIIEQHSFTKDTLSSLEQSQEENKKMMHIVAHDLRNPLNSITSLAALMLDESERSEEDKAMLEMMKTSGQNSLVLVNDLLHAHSSEEDGKRSPVDFHAMLTYCAELLRFKAEEKNQHIELEIEHLTSMANGEKIWRVVSNLMANAIKFSPYGATIVVKMWSSRSNHLIIAVKDDGIGVPKEIGEHIFDLFTEAKRYGTAGEEPFGLGLSISKQIVEAHGGTIWFESASGKGTTFFMDLPIVG